MGLISFRYFIQPKAKKSPVAYKVAIDDLRLFDNVVIVVDEFSNWHNNFEAKYFNSATNVGGTGEGLTYYLGDTSGTDLTVDKIKSFASKVAKETLDELGAEVERIEREGGTKEEKEKLEKEIKKLNLKAKDEDSTETCLFLTALWDKYKSPITVMMGFDNAGEDTDFRPYNDLILIGQQFTGFPNTTKKVTFKDLNIL